MPKHPLRVAVVGGIYGKPDEYRARFRITPETTLERGLRQIGVDVSTFSHYAKIEGRFDVIHVHHLSWGTMQAAVQNSKSAFVFTPHNGKHMAGTLDWNRRKAMAFAMRRADGVVALSAAEAAFHRARYPVEGAINEVIPNGIDACQYAMRRTNDGGKSGRWELLYVGQLDPMKRVDLLIRAVAALALPITLKLVYQNAKLEPELKALARQLGVESSVHFVGFKDPTELSVLYNNADLFVLPSVSEALPSVVTEAMLTGTPVISTDTGGVRTQLAGFGCLVPPLDLQALSRAIQDVLERYGEVQERALEMSQYATKTFSNANMIDRHMELYARVMTETTRRRNRPELRPMNALIRTSLSKNAKISVVALPK